MQSGTGSPGRFCPISSTVSPSARNVAVTRVSHCSARASSVTSALNRGGSHSSSSRSATVNAFVRAVLGSDSLALGDCFDTVSDIPFTGAVACSTRVVTSSNQATSTGLESSVRRNDERGERWAVSNSEKRLELVEVRLSEKRLELVEVRLRERRRGGRTRGFVTNRELLLLLLLERLHDPSPVPIRPSSSARMNWAPRRMWAAEARAADEHAILQRLESVVGLGAVSDEENGPNVVHDSLFYHGSAEGTSPGGF